MKLYISNDVKGMEVKKPGKAFRRVLMKSQPALKNVYVVRFKLLLVSIYVLKDF